MAAKITQEKIELINELYYEIGIKSHVAKMVGCSPATVTKYLILNYVPKAKRQEIQYDVEIQGCDKLIQTLKNRENELSFSESFLNATLLTEKEKEDIELLRKEIFI